MRSDAVRIPNATLRFRPTNDMFAALNQPVPPEAAGGGRGRGGPGRGQNAQAGTGSQGSQGAQSLQGAQSSQGAPASAPADHAAAGGDANSRGGRERRNRGDGQNADAQAGGGGNGGRGGRGGQNADFQGGAGRGGGRGPMTLDRFKSMPPDQQKQAIDRMKSRGEDTKAYEAAMKGAPKPAAAKYGEVSPETIDALFPPLVAKESRGRVWVYEGNQIKPVNVRLGITDGNQTELLDNSLQPGTELVTGIVLPGATRAGAFGPNNGNPLLPGRGPGGPGGGFGGPGGGGGGRGR